MRQRSVVPEPQWVDPQKKTNIFLFDFKSLATSFDSRRFQLHNYSSSLFFCSYFAFTLALVFMFLAIENAFIRNTTAHFFSFLLHFSPRRHRLSAYLWSRCSFPNRSPTRWSPRFSLPPGPGTLHMKTPVQVAHTRTYSYQWFRILRTHERSWIPVQGVVWCQQNMASHNVHELRRVERCIMAICKEVNWYLIELRIESLLLHWRLVLGLFSHIRLQDTEKWIKTGSKSVGNHTVL